MMFIDEMSSKGVAIETHNTNLIRHVQLKEGLTQIGLAERLNKELWGKVTQSNISRWASSSGFVPRGVGSALAVMGKLDWDPHQLEKMSMYRGTYFNEMRWRVFVSSKENQEKWENYSKKSGGSIEPVFFLLLLNKIGFKLESDFDKFTKDEFCFNLLKGWTRRCKELQVWINKTATLTKDNHFIANHLWRVAFAQVIQDQDAALLEKYINPYDLSYEIESISQRSYIFHRTLVFMSRTEGGLGFLESEIGDILIDNPPIPFIFDNDQAKPESLKEDNQVDTAQWSKAEQEIYKKLSTMEKSFQKLQTKQGEKYDTYN